MAGRFATLFGAAAIGTALACAVAGDAAAQFYKDKTINIIIGLRPGGTVDTFARSFASTWSKHIPGNPTMVVKNMTGSGSMRAQNYVYEVAEADGTTIYWGPWDPVAQALEVDGLRARYDDIEFLGGTGAIRVSYTRTDVLPGDKKMTKPEQIMMVDDDFKVGGSTATGIPTILNILSLDVLGVDYDYVGGYKGGSGVRAAQQRNEVQGYQTSITTFRRTGKDALAAGDWLGLYYLVTVEDDGSFEKNQYVKTIPTFPDLYKQIHGKAPAGEKWEALRWLTNLVGEMTFMGFARKGTPPEALEALRKGYAAGMKDPEFVEPAMKAYGVPYSFVSVDKGVKVLGTVKSVDPKTLDVIKGVIKSAES